MIREGVNDKRSTTCYISRWFKRATLLSLAGMRVIKDDEVGGSLEGRDIPSCFTGELDYVLLSEETIDSRLQELAEEVTSLVGSSEPLTLLCILKGAFPTLSLLNRHLLPLRSGPTFFHFVRLSSYHGDRSSGKVTLETGPLPDLSNSHVLVVEDIVETGKTMEALQEIVSKDKAPKSFRVLSLLRKRIDNPAHAFQPDFIGFSIPNKFVVGFGLDYNEFYRELPFIAVISQLGIQNHKL